MMTSFRASGDADHLGSLAGLLKPLGERREYRVALKAAVRTQVQHPTHR